MLRELSSQFSYLDLICTDTGIYEESVSQYLVEAAKQEHKYCTKGVRLERVRLRISRVEKFIVYLAEEEACEREAYSLNMPIEDMFTIRSTKAFEKEKRKALARAARQQLRGRRSKLPAALDVSIIRILPLNEEAHSRLWRAAIVQGNYPSGDA